MNTRARKEVVEYGPQGWRFTLIGVLLALVCVAAAMFETYIHNEGGIFVFALFGGIFLGLAGCGCKVTKREWKP